MATFALSHFALYPLYSISSEYYSCPKRIKKQSLLNFAFVGVEGIFLNKDKITGSAKVAKKGHSFNVTTSLQSSSIDRE